MKIRLSELRQMIREELTVIEEAATEEIPWPAEIPTPADLMSLGPKTLTAIINRSEEKVEGKRKTKVELGPELDGTQEWPVTVSYPGKTPKAQRVEVTWESADQFKKVLNYALNVGNAERNRKIADAERVRRAGGGSAKYAYQYATGMRSK